MPLSCERCGEEQEYEVCRSCGETEYAVRLFVQAVQNIFSSKAGLQREARRRSLHLYYLSLARDGEEDMARTYMGICDCGCGALINWGYIFVSRGDRLYLQGHDPAGGERRTA